MRQMDAAEIALVCILSLMVVALGLAIYTLAQYVAKPVPDGCVIAYESRAVRILECN